MLDCKTKKMIKEWVEKDNGDTERTAKWMARTLKIAGIRQCREWIKESLETNN